MTQQSKHQPEVAESLKMNLEQIQGWGLESLPRPPKSKETYNMRSNNALQNESSHAEDLAKLRDDIGDCTRCVLHKGRTNLVFGVGSAEADLMFVGEGPGADEDIGVKFAAQF